VLGTIRLERVIKSPAGNLDPFEEIPVADLSIDPFG